MKLAFGRIEEFVRRPDPRIPFVLVYGPDTGLVRERVGALARTVVEDLKDPFRVGELTAATLKDDPARLHDEAAALSLTGGRRVVILRDATDGMAAPIGDLLSSPPGDSLVLIEAGDLPARSALRRLFEGADNAAALPCYADEGRNLEAVIRESLTAAGKSAEPDALAYLAGHLGGDRLATRSELDKLMLYLGGAPRLTLEDAVACVGDSSALSLDELALAVGSGDMAGLDRMLERSLSEGQAPVTILRAVLRHFQRLHLAAGQIRAGASVDQAVASLKPPVFFKAVDRVKAQLKFWPAERLSGALELLTRAEIDCKTTGLPAPTLCARRLMELGRAGLRLRTGRSS